MPFDQTPSQISYPPVQTDVWVVISRLSESPIRVVSNLSAVNHASEFAIPFPTGRIPYKVDLIELEVQEYDSLERPLYDDGSPEGTTDSEDIDGEPYPPKLITIEEERPISIRDYPDRFTLAEVLDLCKGDFLRSFSFYDYAQIFLFDDRYDATSIYQDIQESSGLASAAAPFFMGPIRFSGDIETDPQGHLLLIAPYLTGMNWFWQRRHGVAGVSGGVGPLLDIEHASRLGEVFRIQPFTNFVVTPAMLEDANLTPVETNHYWIRTEIAGGVDVQRPYPVVPFIIILGRSSDSPDL